MRITCISDTHTMHRRVSIPSLTDVLVHAGDLTFDGKLKHIEDFNEWIGELKEEGRIQHAVVIGGNHDWSLYKPPMPAAKLLTNCHYLNDSGVEIDGVKFYGSPWTPAFMEWAFMLHTPGQARAKWEKIPDGVDVLVTHGPPRGVLDLVLDGPNKDMHVGCPELLARVQVVKPKFHVFGHIHEGYGAQEKRVGTAPGAAPMELGITSTMFVNASICDVDYQTSNLPIGVEIEP